MLWSFGFVGVFYNRVDYNLVTKNIKGEVMTIFHKIVAGEIPCQKVYEDEFTLAFHDINPRAPIHILIVPKNFFVDFQDVDLTTLGHMQHAVKEVVKLTGLDRNGYRLITNVGKDGGQEVPYIHFHVLGGTKLKWAHLTDDSDPHMSL
jgi:histidine triad (HIT) family protein